MLLVWEGLDRYLLPLLSLLLTYCPQFLVAAQIYLCKQQHDFTGHWILFRFTVHGMQKSLY